MDINTRMVMFKNVHIENEFIKYGTITPKKPDGFFMKRKSPETIQRDRLQQRYESRKNICPTCFTTKSSAGTCNCTD